MDSYVCVEVGDQKKNTGKKENTDSPYFNEYFVFDFHENIESLLEKIVSITVFPSASFLLTKKPLGSITMDVGTIYAQKDHQFFHTWALLLSPEDMLLEKKGYIKCTMAVLGKDDLIKTPSSSPENESDDVEMSILSEGQIARYVCFLYKVHGDLSLSDPCKASVSKKNATIIKEIDLMNCFAEVKFGNLTGTTSAKRGSGGRIEWNEQIAFLSRFPPLFHKMVIRIIDTSSTKSGEIIVKHVLKMKEISSDEKEGFPPSFGPAYIYMYAQDPIKGCEVYRAKLLFSLKTIFSMASHNMEIAKGSLVEVGPVINREEFDEENMGNFLVFCSVLQVHQLNKKIDQKKVHLELSFGTDSISTAEVFRKTKSKNRNSKKSEQDFSTRINGSNKPCLWINSLYPNKCSYRVYQSNIVSRIVHFVENALLRVSDLLENKRGSEAQKEVDVLLRGLAEQCRNGFYLMEAKQTEDGMRTILDWNRLRMLRKELEYMTCVSTELRKSLTQNSMENFKNIVKSFASKMAGLMKDPQKPYPDVIITVTEDEDKVAQRKFEIDELLYSPEIERRGVECGAKRIILFKAYQKRNSKSRTHYPLAMAVELQFWAGFVWENPDFYLHGLASGFTTDEDNIAFVDGELQRMVPPLVLLYFEKHKYQFRAHVFQGRFVPGSDATGLADPFVRVSICNNILTTQVKNQTLNPTWDQMLLLSELTLYGIPTDIQSNPPTIVIEAMDKDKYGKMEFMGRGVSEPVVKRLKDKKSEENPKLRLKWMELLCGGECAGEILAAFELIELTGGKEDASLRKDITSRGDLYRVPPYIRPHLILYNLKVLFWGLRSFGKGNLNLDSYPIVTIEVGAVKLKSFSDPEGDGYLAPSFATAEVELPRNLNYTPPVIIKVWEKRSFGRLVQVGSHIAGSVASFSGKRDSIMWPTPIAKEITTGEGEDSIESDGEVSTNEEIDPSKEPLIKTKLSKIRMAQQRLQRLSPLHRTNKESNFDVADVDSFDWWTKYYESLKTSKERDKEMEDPCRGRCVKFSLDKEELNLPEMEQEKQVTLHIFDDLGCSSSLHDDHRLLGRLKKCFKGILDFFKFTKPHPHNKDFDGEDKKEKKKLEKESSRKNVKKITTASFIIYPNELEKQPEFNKFEDWMDSFAIFHGKKQEVDSQDSRIVGKFKGLVETDKSNMPQIKGHKTVEKAPSAIYGDTTNNSTSDLTVSAEPIVSPTFKVLIRVYVVRAFSLPPKDISGRADPYVVVSVGKTSGRSIFWRRQKYNKPGRRVSGDRDEHVSQDLNPIFGRCYEVEAILPKDDIITVEVWDRDFGGSDDFIGATEIDIENRFYSKHRATCGISSSYSPTGYNTWRDPEKPSKILKNLCEHFKISAPVYRQNLLHIGKSTLYVEDKKGLATKMDEQESSALLALKKWSEIAVQEGRPGFSLVPEHIETRSLFNPNKEGIEQGKLELWVDMFTIPKGVEGKESTERLLGPPVNISPRKPKVYELRVIIWNTADIELCDTDILMGTKSSDIYVKGWLYGPETDGQTTDVHYRSLNGEGNFNWRFVFPLLHLPQENCIVTPTEEDPGKMAFMLMKSLFTGSENQAGQKTPCRFNLQVWDEDRFTADDFIGALTLDLSNCLIGAKTAKACKSTLLTKKSKRINLFKTKRLMRGWWPVGKWSNTEDNPQNGDFQMTGKIELEMLLVDEKDIQIRPVGKGREGPSPLPEPQRPDTSFSWFTNPMKIFKYAIWSNNRKSLIIWIVTAMFIVFILLSLYSIPGYLMKRIIGA